MVGTQTEFLFGRSAVGHELAAMQQFTPPDLALELAKFGLAGHAAAPRLVLDPACGDGVLLEAAGRLLGTRTKLVGIEVDPALAIRARKRVPRAKILEGDAIFDFTLEADCVLMNPPFGGTATIGRVFGHEYRKRLGALNPHAKGPVDLAAFFLHHFAQIVSPGGTMSIIAPNTLAQGATRRAGLKPLLAKGWSIYRATRSAPWPGRAKVSVCIVHLHNGDWTRGCTLL